MALKVHQSSPPRGLCRPRWQLTLQTVYAVLFAGLLVLPNLVHAPNLMMAGLAALVAVWIFGCLSEWRGFGRADELMLCGSAAPVVLGIWTIGTRLAFIYNHQALTDPRIPGVTASGFIVIWVLEILLVLLPGAAFFAMNIRALRPVPSSAQGFAPKRPSSRKRRT